MEKITKSHHNFGGFILVSFLLVNYLFKFIQYQISDVPDESTYMIKTIINFLILGIPFILFLINILVSNIKFFSIIGFLILAIYEVTKIIPDIYYYNMTKVSSPGYFILIYSIISIILILRDKKKS